jgi:hypothetical protein
MSFYEMSEHQQKEVLIKMWSVVISYYVTPFPIGMNFAVNTMFWKEEWDKGTAISGLIMSTGEFLGLFVLTIFMTKTVFESPLTQPFKKPMNLVVATLVSSISVYLVSFNIPGWEGSMWISALAASGVHIVNVQLHSFVTEAATAWAPRDVYAMWMGRCYVAKRASNATMAFLCVGLYFSVGRRAPYFVVGSIVFTWGLVLGGLYWYLNLLPFQQPKDAPRTSDRRRSSGSIVV